MFLPIDHPIQENERKQNENKSNKITVSTSRCFSNEFQTTKAIKVTFVIINNLPGLRFLWHWNESLKHYSDIRIFSRREHTVFFSRKFFAPKRCFFHVQQQIISKRKLLEELRREIKSNYLIQNYSVNPKRMETPSWLIR